MKPIIIDTANGSLAFLNLDNVQVISFPKHEISSLTEEFDIDILITDQIINKALLAYDFNCLILPYSLTDNFLEFIGLRVAYHVRLSKSLGAKQNVPILFIGNQSPWEILRLTPLAEIISLEGSYWSRLNIENIEKALRRLPLNLPGLENREYFLDRISVPPPSNYSSHHSVANEWSLLRWSEYIGIDGSLETIKNKINSLLYYKYLTTIYGDPKITETKDYNINEIGKILLIDDETNAGWGIFFNSFFTLSPNIEFNSWNINFKSKRRQEIISEFESYFNSNNADLIILDLRLCDEDFNENLSPKELTGYHLLKHIKEVNKGIQVIVFSATNKIWNLLELQKEGADGFVMKEAPELSFDKNFTINSVDNLYYQLVSGLKMRFLKSINTKITTILKLIQIQKLSTISAELSAFYEQTVVNLNVAFNLFQKSKENLKYKNYGFLQLFQIIEDFVGLNEIYEDGDSSYVHCQNRKVCVLKLISDPTERNKSYDSALKYVSHFYQIEQSNYTWRVDTNLKVSALLLFRYGNPTSNVKKWNNITYNRNNKAAHGGETQIIRHNDTLDLLDFINYILDNNNQNLRNIENGLERSISS